MRGKCQRGYVCLLSVLVPVVGVRVHVIEASGPGVAPRHHGRCHDSISFNLLPGIPLERAEIRRLPALFLLNTPEIATRKCRLTAARRADLEGVVVREVDAGLDQAVNGRGDRLLVVEDAEVRVAHVVAAAGQER